MNFIYKKIFFFTVCPSKYYVMDRYEQHVTGHNQKISTICEKCSQAIHSWKSLKKHILKCQKICQTHCIYCDYGTNKVSEILNHLTNNHASEIPISCSRMLNNETEVSKVFMNRNKTTCFRIFFIKNYNIFLLYLYRMAWTLNLFG